MQFRDLKKQYEILKTDIDNKVKEVCESAHFISGPEVAELEKMLAEYVGVRHCITCANGTDAISLAIKAWGLGKGDAVFVPDFTFFSSGECPAGENCTCVFVDVDENTFNIDSMKLEVAIKKVIKEGKNRPKAVIAVDLFGQPADYDDIKRICKKYNLLLLEDGAQGFGGEINGKKACSFGDISTTSFFPAKPLGCYGDGGAVFTDDDEWAALIRSFAVHGKAGNDKYNNIRIGLNSRLDTIQAAILQVKLDAFKKYELKNVNIIAAGYENEFRKYDFGDKITLPFVKDGYMSSWAQYTLKLSDNIDRDKLQSELSKRNIPTMVYYMKPMHMQGAFKDTESANADCSVTEKLCRRVISLPMHPYLEQKQIEYIVETLYGLI